MLLVTRWHGKGGHNMRTALGKEDYLEYYNRVLEKLEHEKDYVTGLDAATGDGDHWANMYAGFKKLIDS